MYRLGSRMLIIVSCVMAIVRALPVNTEMVIWILTGVIICEDMKVMKDGAILINTSRGALIDEPALIEALEKHQIAGAGLDVQETEPPKADNPLYTLDNVILTPHMGWKGLETRQRLVSILAGNVKGFLEGKPVNVVS